MPTPSRRGLEQLAERLAGLTFRRPYLFLIAALLIAGASIWGIGFLKIDHDLTALLPADTASVVRLDKLKKRIGAPYNVLVSIESPSRKANLAYGQALAKRLREIKELRTVVFRRDLTFFRQHALLYLPLADLLELRRKVIKRIKREVRKRNKLIVDLDDDDDAGKGSGSGSGAGTGTGTGKGKGDDDWDSDKYDPDRWFTKQLGGAQVPGEYMQAQGGQIIVISCNPRRASTDVQFTRRLVAKVKRAIAAAKPKSFHAKLTATVEGHYAERAGRVSAAAGDISRTAIFAVTALLLVIVIYFRSLRSVPIVLLPVVISTLLTLGLAAPLYGTLNIVTTFIFAILLGLGIDFGIHLLARYRFERQRGLDAERGLSVAMSSTGPALLAGAATTMAVMFLLSLGRFQGFAQFGVVAGIGVGLALLAALTVVPAAVAALERLRPEKSKAQPAVNADGDKAPGGDAGKRAWNADGPPPRRGIAWIVVAVSFAAAAFSLVFLGDVGFEYDFNKLGRPKSAADRAAEKATNYRDAVGRASTWGRAVALCRTRARCADVTQLLSGISTLKRHPKELRHVFGSGAGIAGARAGSGTGTGTGTGTGSAASDGGDDDDDDDLDDDPFAKMQRELGKSRLLPAQRRRLRALGKKRLDEMMYFLQAYVSLDTFVPPNQRDKLRVIADIKKRVDRKWSKLPKKARDKLYPYLKVKTEVTAKRLPRWVRDQFAESDGGEGRFVVIWNRGAKADYNDSNRIYKTFFDLPVDADGGGTVPVSASYFVLVEVIDTLRADGPRVIGAAAIGVFVCLLLMFRSLKEALLVLAPLLVSIAWLVGVFLVLDLKLNLYSVVAFPLLVGLAIDDGIHILHRWREIGRLRVVLREVGGAVTLTTLTTFIGFAGLSFAGHVGIKTLGITAGIGLWLTWLGAVATLPALLYALRRHPAALASDSADDAPGPSASAD